MTLSDPEPPKITPFWAFCNAFHMSVTDEVRDFKFALLKQCDVLAFVMGVENRQVKTKSNIIAAAAATEVLLILFY